MRLVELEPGKEVPQTKTYVVQLRGLQKLTAPLKLLVTVAMKVDEQLKKATVQYETSDIPYIAKKFIH